MYVYKFDIYKSSIPKHFSSKRNHEIVFPKTEMIQQLN